MKTLITFLVFLSVTFFGYAQISHPVIRDSLSIVTSVNYNEVVDFKGYKLKFKSVISDSRCPKDVMCIRAGEAFVVVSVYKNDTFIKDQKVRIDANDYVMESTNLILKDNACKIYATALLPYNTSLGVESMEYELEILINPI